MVNVCRTGHQFQQPKCYNGAMDHLTITRPDDWHIHLRDEAALPTTVRDVGRVFKRAIVMPNLVPPVTSAEAVNAYRERIIAARPEDNPFEPLMTLYLTDQLTPADIERAIDEGHITACKLYPAGATTNSDAGVTSIANLDPLFACLEARGIPLLIHGEVTDTEIDVFDRERAFIDTELTRITEHFPNLKVVFEHITTADAVQFVEEAGANVAATITAHHLLYNRTHMLGHGMKPMLFCLPILKRDVHQQALIAAATSGDPSFFLGTDSAPHPQDAKENICGCAAGCYTAHAAIELYAEVFDQAGSLDRLEGFASHFGPDFYGLPRNEDTITLSRESWQPDETLDMGGAPLKPLRGGEWVSWRVTSGAY